MVKARTFHSPDDLCNFINTVAGITNIISIYFDTASGHHVLIYKG